MAILHYNNDYVNSSAVDPNAFYVCPFVVEPSFIFLFACLFYLLWFHFVGTVRFASLCVAVAVDSFEDNL